MFCEVSAGEGGFSAEQGVQGRWARASPCPRGNRDCCLGVGKGSPTGEKLEGFPKLASTERHIRRHPRGY